MMADMRTHVNSLTESVKKIEQNEGDVAKKVGSIDTQMAQMKSQIEQVKTQMGQLETKVDNVNPWLPWKFIGRGYEGSYGHSVYKEHTTLQECIAFCTKKRQDSGAKWNGFDWHLRDGLCCCYENDVGHTEELSPL